MKYPARVRNLNGYYVVSFRDFPKLVAQNTSQTVALQNATAMMLSGVSDTVKQGKKLPTPSAQEPGELMIRLPLCYQAKIILIEELQKRNIGKHDFADMMGVSRQQADRLMDISYPSKMAGIEDALACLGKEINVFIEEVVPRDQPVVVMPAYEMQKLVRALNGPYHYIRELQATRNLDGSGITRERNPIDVVTEVWNKHVQNTKKG